VFTYATIKVIADDMFSAVCTASPDDYFPSGESDNLKSANCVIVEVPHYSATPSEGDGLLRGQETDANQETHTKQTNQQQAA
jgi:hypothetical protein